MSFENILGSLYKIWILLPVLVSACLVLKGVFLFKKPKASLNIMSGILCFVFYLLYKFTITYALPNISIIDTIGLFFMNLLLIPAIILSSSSIFEDNARKIFVFPLCLVLIWSMKLIDTAFAAMHYLD